MVWGLYAFKKEGKLCSSYDSSSRVLLPCSRPSMATKPRPELDWSSLPDSLLTFIAELLPTHVDILRFRAVCRSFRSSVTLSPEHWLPYPNFKIPARIPSDSDPESEPVQLVLKQSALYVIEPLTNVSTKPEKTNTWVLRVEQLDSGFVSLKKPFCREHYWELRNKFPESLNLLDYRVKVLGKIYMLDLYTEIDKYDAELYRKVVVSDDGSAIMALLYEDDGPIIWRNRVGDWAYIDDVTECDLGSYCEDIIYHKGNFYAVYQNNLLMTVGPQKFNMDITELELQNIPLLHSKYLVKSCNDLFLVIKYYEGGSVFNSYGNYSRQKYIIRFRILKFDEEEKEFFPEHNAFADRLVFIGEDFSFSVSAKEFPGLKPNCVYFEDGVLSYLMSPSDGYDDTSLCIGAYDFKGNAPWLLSCLPHTTICTAPTWLKSSSSSSR